MSLEKAVKLLAEAISLLDQWGRVKVGEIEIVNKAYRRVYEAYYLLRSLEKKLQVQERSRRGLLDRLWSAVRKLKWALEELGRGRRNPAAVYVLGARTDVDSVLKRLVKTQLTMLHTRLNAIARLLEELRRV